MSYSDDLMRWMDASEEFYDNVSDMPYEMYMGLLSMLLERRCRDEGRDITNDIKMLHEACLMVNQDYGETEWGLR